MKHILATFAAATVATTLVMGGSVAAADQTATGSGDPLTAKGGYRAQLERYAQDTWASLAAMTDEATGLPSDNIDGTLTTPGAYTSPTNIGGYLWSTVTARDLGIISTDDATARMTATITTLESLERNTASGMFYNWYDPASGAKLTTWPDSGDVVEPFLSTVDNGWLAAALRIVREAEPGLAARADDLYRSMDFAAFFDVAGAPGLPAGTNRGGFWDSVPSGCSIPAPM